jgi:hypothetical protein
MKRLNIYRPLVALMLAALAIPAAAAQKLVAFNGTIQGQDTDKGFTSPGMFLVETNGTVNGTLLDQFKFTLESTINVAESTGTGLAHFKTGNGDTLDATSITTKPAELTPTPDGFVFSIKEFYTIAGGTGRFAGAQGSFVMERVADPQKFITFGSFYGVITSPGAAH